MENPFWIIVFSFVMAGVPMLVSLGTSYIKVHIVLGMLRNGLGTQNVPGSMVIAALSLAVTGIVMEPVLQETLAVIESKEFQEVEDPFELLSGELLADLLQPWKEFMSQHAGEKEVKVFSRLRETSQGATEQEGVSQDSISVVVPAFIVSELKESFAMAFALLLPFLVIDLVVSNILVGLGMFMVSPVLISLPLKLMIFVFADGWLLLVHGLIHSYQLGT
jgi:type III secretion protein R